MPLKYLSDFDCLLVYRESKELQKRDQRETEARKA